MAKHLLLVGGPTYLDEVALVRCFLLAVRFGGEDEAAEAAAGAGAWALALSAEPIWSRRWGWTTSLRALALGREGDWCGLVEGLSWRLLLREVKMVARDFEREDEVGLV